MIKTLTTDSFDEVISGHFSVLVEFGAEWCGACKSFIRVLEGLDKDRTDVVFATVDVGEEPAIADRFGITSLPVLIFFKDGAEVWKECGVLPRRKLESMIGASGE
jgi:thioredoxin 1